MKINVLFFGILADKTGLNSKEYEGIKNINELKLVVESEFPMIKKYSYRISINKNLCEANELLNDKDEVAMLPPFAGG